MQWREQIAADKTRRFENEAYWGKPVPSFGPVDARLLIVGLAPAAHGANRTGRMFTGDRSGDWLYRALHRFGFANQPHSSHLADGLQLLDCYITAVIHCAPPLNRPSGSEISQCSTYLHSEWQTLKKTKVVVALGRVAFDSVLRLQVRSKPAPRKPTFRHGLEVSLEGRMLLASFHPSQQNTFTGRLTEEMFDSIFRRARQILRD
ncbi:MAG: uracil-DNA glycosylase [Acidobacteriota bacterium]